MASAPSPSPHDRSRSEEDEDDPVDGMISKTGCAELHYALQDCMAEHQDWRKCQTEVQKFKECMSTYQNSRKEQLLKQRTSATQTAWSTGLWDCCTIKHPSHFLNKMHNIKTFALKEIFHERCTFAVLFNVRSMRIWPERSQTKAFSLLYMSSNAGLNIKHNS